MLEPCEKFVSRARLKEIVAINSLISMNKQ